MPEKAEGGGHRGGNFQIVQAVRVFVDFMVAPAQHDRGVLGGVGAKSFHCLFQGGKIVRDVQRKAVWRVGKGVGPKVVQRPADAAGQGVIFRPNATDIIEQSQSNICTHLAK